MRGLPASLALLLACVQVAHGDDWPQWRGPRRDGVAPSAKLPAAWPRDFPAPVWKAVVGEGQASPAVAGGRVYIMGRYDDRREVCACLDAATGKPLWSHGYDAPYQTPDPRGGNGPKSTPVVDSGRVYLFGVAGMLTCLDAASGKVHWQRDCGKEFWGVLKDKEGDDAWATACGAATTAVIEGNLLILPVGGEKAGGFTAFDKRDGSIVWKSLTDRSSYASPVVADLAGTRQVVGFTGLRMVGLAVDSGKLLWEHPFPAKFDQTVLTPVLYRDLVIFGGEGRPTLALKIQREGPKVVKTLAWQNKDLRATLTTPVVHGSHLYGLNGDRRQLVCVDLATGATAWLQEGYPSYVSLVVAGDTLLVLGNDGMLEAVRPDPAKFVSLGRWKVAPGETWSHLTVTGSRLYLKDRDTLYCFEMGG
jgi:outer membrane protein assembly factor BamB